MKHKCNTCREPIQTDYAVINHENICTDCLNELYNKCGNCGCYIMKNDLELQLIKLELIENTVIFVCPDCYSKYMEQWSER